MKNAQLWGIIQVSSLFGEKFESGKNFSIYNFFFKTKTFFWWKCPPILWLCLGFCCSPAPWHAWQGLEHPGFPVTLIPSLELCTRCVSESQNQHAFYQLFHTNYSLCLLGCPWALPRAVTHAPALQTRGHVGTSALTQTHPSGWLELTSSAPCLDAPSSGSLLRPAKSGVSPFPLALTVLSARNYYKVL